MSFLRYALANLRIAFVPKIGTSYRFASDKPFETGPVMVPKKLSRGFVLYETTHPSGFVLESTCEFGVFASMFREVA